MEANRIIKVAYVEDQSGFRKSLCSFLESKGQVSIVYDTDSGHDLLDFLKRAIPLPDVCILDVSMPTIDGLSLLKLIRKVWRRLPCLIYSMHGSEHTVRKAIYLGANGYFTKQSRFEELYEAILSIVKSGVAYSDVADAMTFEEILEKKVKVPHITDRERMFIRYATSELSYSEIARQMNITEKTVEGYRRKCYEKLNVSTRVGLTLAAVRLGIINI